MKGQTTKKISHSTTDMFVNDELNKQMGRIFHYIIPIRINKGTNFGTVPAINLLELIPYFNLFNFN